jgi:lysophospholipase L1-like esterase
VPRKIWKDGRIARAAETHGGWAAEVARAEGAPFLDLNESVARRYEALGPATVASLFADEHTHTNASGAALTAAAVAEGIPALGLPRLTALLRDVAAAPAAPPVLRFQFGDAPARPGFTSVAPATVYSAETGYGFEPGVVPSSSAAKDGRWTAVTADAPFLFSVRVPEGNYQVTVTLGDPLAASVTTVKAETRRLMLERVQAPAGRRECRSFTVNVRGPRIGTGGEVQLDPRERDPGSGTILARHWDDRLTLTFSDVHPAVSEIEVRRVDVPTLFLLGDSTVTDQARWPASSWGQMVTRWFGPGLAVANHAESGETLKGFLRERRLDKVLDAVRPGDFVLVEFGTNDSKDRGPQNVYPGQDFSETYAPAETEFKDLLRRYVAGVRGKGGLPLIVSPTARREEVAPPTSLAAYATAAMEVARETGVPGLDLNAMGVSVTAALGPDGARQFADRTHHVEYGSYLQAKCVVFGLRRAGLPLSRFLRDGFGRFDPRRPEPTPSAFALPYDPPPPAAR